MRHPEWGYGEKPKRGRSGQMWGEWRISTDCNHREREGGPKSGRGVRGDRDRGSKEGQQACRREKEGSYMEGIRSPGTGDPVTAGRRRERRGGGGTRRKCARRAPAGPRLPQVYTCSGGPPPSPAPQGRGAGEGLACSSPGLKQLHPAAAGRALQVTTWSLGLAELTA